MGIFGIQNLIGIVIATPDSIIYARTVVSGKWNLIRADLERK